MSHAARSLFAFGIYVIVTGLALLAAPATFVRVMQLPPVDDGWIRMIGLLAVVIGVYDVVGARNELRPYVRASVPIRFGFAAGVVLLVATGQLGPTVLLFGATDVAGAIWTALALRSAPAPVAVS
jgi:uncharacterized protein YjeT (DUF2065 family)